MWAWGAAVVLICSWRRDFCSVMAWRRDFCPEMVWRRDFCSVMAWRRDFCPWCPPPQGRGCPVTQSTISCSSSWCLFSRECLAQPCEAVAQPGTVSSGWAGEEAEPCEHPLPVPLTPADILFAGLQFYRQLQSPSNTIPPCYQDSAGQGSLDLFQPPGPVPVSRTCSNLLTPTRDAQALPRAPTHSHFFFLSHFHWFGCSINEHFPGFCSCQNLCSLGWQVMFYVPQWEQFTHTGGLLSPSVPGQLGAGPIAPLVPLQTFQGLWWLPRAGPGGVRRNAALPHC